MDRILVEKSPSPSKLEVLGVESWPTKTMAVGKYTYHCESNEEYYVSTGKATIDCGSHLRETLGEGDLVFIPQGLTVTWEVIDAVECHRRPG